MTKYKIKRPLLPPEQKALTVSYNNNTKYDWPLIKREYITGYDNEEGVRVYPTTKELSERHPDVPYGQIRNRASREKWEEYKQKSMREAAVERHKALLKKLNSQAIAFDEQTAEDAFYAQELIKRQMMNVAKQVSLDEYRLGEIFDQIEKGEIEVTELRKYQVESWASPSALESLAKAYALFTEVGRKALGIKDDEPAVHQQVHVEVTHNTTVTQELSKNDPARLEALQRIFQNPNLILPATDTVEGEIVEQKEITDGTEEETE